MDLFYPTPASPPGIFALAALFLTTSDGGRFRFGSVFANTAIAFGCLATNGLQCYVGDRRQASVIGMGSSFLVLACPATGLARWWRLVPVPVSTVYSLGMFSYYANMYYNEVFAVQNAGEDDSEY